jgi:2-polyprenyl-3-methyl-5-hydroxy-6-metoxy-1,4-benzoquinol methylase
MSNLDRKDHWNKIYQSKSLNQVSWYQPVPTTSLDFVKQFNLSKKAKIIDVGGGDSFFVDHLLNLGYQDITVLDISEKAIEKARQRLGDQSAKVKWIIADAASFHTTDKYDLWHDRAAFHFLMEVQEIDNYLETVSSSVKPNGYIVIGTFSEQGPQTCSGINIKQYSEQTMTERFKNFFEKIKCLTIGHKTPSGSIQNFVFCSFRRIETA